MPSQAIRDPVKDNLLTPQSSALKATGRRSWSWPRRGQ